MMDYLDYLEYAVSLRKDLTEEELEELIIYAINNVRW